LVFVAKRWNWGFQDQDHFISGEEAREFFSKSNLNPRQLRDIWYV
jgi:hypothetical protein